MSNAVIGSLRINLAANTAAFDTAMKGVSGKVRASVRGIQDAMRPLSAVSFGAGALGANIVQTAGKFEASMNRVQAVTEATEAQFSAMEDKAKSLGATTSFTASQAAEGMEMLARNGLKTEQILGGAIDGSLKLAAATGSTLSKAADLATDVMAQFDIDAAQFSQTVDTVVGATNNSKFAFDDFRLALGQAGGVAGGLGVEFEEFATAVAATSSSFASGSDAGTSFKTFIQRLVPESKAAREAMAELGLEFFDATGRMKPMREVFGELKTALAGLSEEAKTEKLKTIFGTDAIRTALAAAEAGAEGFDKLSESISNVSADEQAAARLKGFEGSMKKLSSAFEGLKLAIADSGVLDLVTSFVEKMTEIARAVSEADPKIVKFGVVFVGLLAAIAPVVATIGLILTALSAPAVGLIAVVVAAGTAFVVFGDEIKAFLNFAGAKIIEWGGTIKANVTDNIAFIGEVASGVFNGIADLVDSVFPGVGDTITGIFTGVTDTITATFDAVVSRARAAMEFLGLVEKKSESVFDGLKGEVEVRGPGEVVSAAKVAPSAPPSGEKFKPLEFEALEAGAVEKTAAMVDGVTAELNRLRDVAAPVGVRAFNDVTDAADRMDNEVVRNSFVPDMVDGVISHFGRLKSIATPLATTAFDTVTAQSEEMGNKITGALRGAFRSGEFEFANFRDSMIGIGVDLVAKMLANVFFPLSEAAAGGTGGGGGLTTGIGGLIGNAFAGFFADGGFIGPGQFGIVGERGPEFISGGRSGATITPFGQGQSQQPQPFVFAPVINAQGADPAQLRRVEDAVENLSANVRSVFDGQQRRGQ